MVRSRVRLLMVLVSFPFVAIALRLLYLQVVSAERYREDFIRRRRSLQVTTPSRGRILDRQGRVLAEDETVFDLVFRLGPLHPRELAFAEFQAAFGLCDEDPPPGTGEMCTCGHLDAALYSVTGLPRNVEARLRANGGAALEPVDLVREIPPGRLRKLSTELLRDLEAAGHVFEPEPGGETCSLRVQPQTILTMELTLLRLERLCRVPYVALLERVEKARDELHGSDLNPWGRDHFRNKEYHLLVEDVSKAVLTEILYHPGRYPGIEPRSRARRRYPLGAIAGLVTGYTRGMPATVFEDLRRRDLLLDTRMRNMDAFYREFEALRETGRFSADLVGHTGLEARYDDRLRGRPGLRIDLKDVRGRLRPQAGFPPIEAVSGEDLRSTLDGELQEILHGALRDTCEIRRTGPAASAAIMNLRTGPDGAPPGALLALACYPAVDPNRMDRSEYAAYAREMESYPRLSHGGPFWARPVSLFFYPGSVFKLMVSIAAMENGTVSREPDTRARRGPGHPSVRGDETLVVDRPLEPGQRFPCRRAFYPRFPNILRCASTNQHNVPGGELDLHQALKYSCNTYFYYVCRDRLRCQDLVHWARQFGYGRPSGIDLGPPGSGGTGKLARGIEGRGMLAYAIGQVHVRASVLQVLRATAGIALDGAVPWPYLVEPREPERLTLRFPGAGGTLASVREGMRRAFCESGGTAHKPGLRAFRAAAKTGTAETGRPGEDIAWLTGYWPLESPRIAFTICVEDTPEHGGDATAPILASVLEFLETRQRLEETVAGPPVPPGPGRGRGSAGNDRGAVHPKEEHPQ